MNLRSYQAEAIDSLEQELSLKPNALLVLATGLGKTETIFGFCLRLLDKKPNAKILFLVNKVSLVNQAAKRAEPYFDVGVYCGSENRYETDKAFTVASIQSIYGAGYFYDLIILDEVHRAQARTYSDFIESCRIHNPNLKVIGLTATPFNSQGYIYGPDQMFEKISYEKGLKWAIENGWLVKPVLKHNDQAFDTDSLHTKLGDFDQAEVKALTTKEDKILAQITDVMPKIKDRKKIIWHCSCIDHAELVSQIIPEFSVVIHSRMDKSGRDLAMKEFEQGQCRHLVFVMIVSEGYDFPPIDTVVLMRPTKSPIVYIQSIGRALRTSAGKTDCLVLDYAQVVRRCGPLDSPNVSNGSGRSKDYLKTSMKFCKACYAYQDMNNSICENCGHDFVKEKLEEQKTRLKSLTRTSDDDSQILSADKEPLEIVHIWPQLCKASPYIAKSGNKCIKIAFNRRDLMSGTIYKFIPIMDGFWVNKFVNEQLSKIVGFEYKKFNGVESVEQACRDINSTGFKHIEAIKVQKKGKYYDIKGYIYAENDDEKEKTRIC